ncbi:uncharacterized protein LOC144163311 isoform X2 [Haemaphysalis longicornis]
MKPKSSFAPPNKGPPKTVVFAGLPIAFVSIASEPEIYLKSGQFADQSWSHGDDSGLDEAYLNARRAHEIIERRIGALSPPLSSPDAFLPHVDSTRLALSRPSKSRRAASNGAVAASAATTYQWNGADSGPYQHHRVTTTTTTTTHRSSTTVEEKSTRDSVHVLRRPLPSGDDERDLVEREGKPDESQRQRALAATRAEEEDRVHEERTVGEGDGPELSDAPPAPSPGAFRRRSSVAPSAVVGGADAKDLPGAKDQRAESGDRAEASPQQEHRRESFAEPPPAAAPRDRSSSDGAGVITLALPTEAAGTVSRLGGFQHRRPSLSDARRKSVAVVPVPESSKLSVPLQQQRKLSFAGESVGPRRGGGDQDSSGGQRLKSQAESEEAVSQDIEGESERPQRRPSREAESRRASSVATLEREEESQVEQEADAETKPEADQEAKPEVGTSSAEEASIEQEGPAGGPASSSEEIVRSASEAERRPIEEAETDNGFRDGGREAGEAKPEGDSRYFREEGTYRFEVTQEEEQDEERAVAQTSWSVAPVGKGDVEEASGRQRTWKTTGGGDKASRRSKYPSLEREQQKQQQQPTRVTRGAGKKAAPAATRVTGMSGEKTVVQCRRRGQPGVTVQVAKVRLIPGRPVDEAGTAEAEAEASEIREYVRQGAKSRKNACDMSKKSSRQTVANVDTARTVVESYRKSDAAAAAEAKKPKRERTFDVEVYVTELGDTGTQTGGAANISAKAAREHSSSRGGAGGSGERRRSRAQRSLGKSGTRGSLQGDRGQTKAADGDTTTDADGGALAEGATDFHSTAHDDHDPSADDTSTLEHERLERLSGDLPNGHHGAVQNTVDENISADDEGSEDENKTVSASRRTRLDDTNTENGVQEEVLASEEDVKATARVPEATDESDHADYQVENSEAHSGEREEANPEPLEDESVVQGQNNQAPPESNISDDKLLELNTHEGDDSYLAGETIEHGSKQASQEKTGTENGRNSTHAHSQGDHENNKLVGSIESHLKNPEIDGDNKTEDTKDSEVVAGNNNTADALGDENSAIDTENQTASGVDNNGLTKQEAEPADAKENFNEDEELASTESSDNIHVRHQESTTEETLEGTIDPTVAGEKGEIQSKDGLETGQTEGSTEKDTMRSVVTVGTRPGSASATEPSGPPAAEHSGEEVAKDVAEAADESEKSQEESTSVSELAVQSEESEESQEINAVNGGPHEELSEVPAREDDAPDTVVDLNDISSEKVGGDSQSDGVPTAESNQLGGDESKDDYEHNKEDSSTATPSDLNPNVNEEHVENSDAIGVPSEELTDDDNKQGLAEDDAGEPLAGVRDSGGDIDNREQSAPTSLPSEVQDGLLQHVTDGVDANTIPSEEAHAMAEVIEPANNREQDNYEEKDAEKPDQDDVQNPDISTRERITSEEAVLQELKSAIEENDTFGDEADNGQDAERKEEHTALNANSSIDTVKVGSHAEEGPNAEEPNDNNGEPFSSDSAPTVKTEDESTEAILNTAEGDDPNEEQDEERINDERSSVAEGNNLAESLKDALKVDVNEDEATEKKEEGEGLESEVTETDGGTGDAVDAEETAGDLESDIERIMQAEEASPVDHIPDEEPAEAEMPGAITDMDESPGKTVDAVHAQERAHGLETEEEHTTQEEKASTTDVSDDSEPAKAEVPAATTDRATPPTDLDTSRAEEDSAFAEGTCTNTPSPATSRAELSSPKDLREGENNDEGILADEPPTAKATEDEHDGEGDGTVDATSSSSGRGSRGTVTEVPLPTNIDVPQIRGGKAQTDSVTGGRAAKVKAPKGIEVLPPRFKPRPKRKAKDSSVGGIGGVRRVHSDGEHIDRAPVGVSRTALTTPEQRLDKGVGRLLGRHSRSVNMEEQGLVEIARLQKKLDALREERLACEAKREDLLRRAKFLQGKATSTRDQARDMWRRRYAEEKKVTPKLEEEGGRWRLELERLHRELLARVEGELRITGFPRFEQPSNKLSYKIMIAKVLQEIEDLKRRLEYTRISLGAEVRLRTHAEREVKNLREDLLKKKIQVTLTKKETQSVMAPFLRDSFYFVGPI